MAKIMFTGGGTSGHITPNIAIINELKKENEIVYVGGKNSMEENLINKEGIDFYGIASGKLRRYKSKENFVDVFRILKGTIQSIRLMFKLKPDLVFSKGGYVSSPVVWAAFLKRVPIIVHESDMTPGLSNRLSMPFAKKVCYTFPETEKYLKGTKNIETGMPIRSEILTGDAEKGLKHCDFVKDMPVVLVVGGSLGSKTINRQVRSSLNDLLKRYQVCHICGKGGIDNSLLDLEGYKQFEYVTVNLANLLKMADVVISRAGATFIFEIVSLKKPNILIPLSLNASRGDQILNAKAFEEAGYSQVVSEEQLEKISIYTVVDQVYENRQGYIDTMESRKTKNGTKKIVTVIKSLLKG